MKLKHFSYLFMLFIFIASCNKIDKPTKPDNLMSEDEMVQALMDMAMLSSAKGVNKSRLENNGIVPEDYVYRKNNIDSTIFAQSNNYYAHNIKTYDAIYQRVKDSLTALRDKYKIEADKEKAKKKITDSIRRIKINKENRIKYDKNTKAIDPAKKKRS